LPVKYVAIKISHIASLEKYPFNIPSFPAFNHTIYLSHVSKSNSFTQKANKAKTIPVHLELYQMDKNRIEYHIQNCFCYVNNSRFRLQSCVTAIYRKHTKQTIVHFLTILIQFMKFSFNNQCVDCVDLKQWNKNTKYHWI